MHGQKGEKRKKLLQSLAMWHPWFLLAALFLLGACSRTSGFVVQPAGTSAIHETQFEEETAKSALTAGGDLTVGSDLTAGGDLTSDGAQAEESERALRETSAATEKEASEIRVQETGNYTSKEEVARYLHLYGHLPSNYIAKRAAEEKGWNAREESLDEILPGMSIGGSTFGNYEGLLPSKKGRRYFECDIDYEGGYRNAKRIVYSNDGLIFYTEDHYQSFEALY